MAIVFFSDPHIGLNRGANTTHRGRQLLKTAMFRSVTPAITHPGQKVCLGDVFDTYSNSEEVILDGGELVTHCNLVLGGNHDVVADADKMGSLGLLNVSHPGKIVMPVFGKVVVDARFIDNIVIASVPHHTTNDLFQQALEQVVEVVAEYKQPKVLLLHCNYDSPYELQETGLNLTPEQVDTLLQTFDYILIGHEHNPRDLYQGRLIMLGNTHPTGFADLSPKRFVVLEDGKMTSHWTYDIKVKYQEYHFPDIPEQTEAEFVRISGDIDRGDLALTVKMISKLWKNNPNLLAVKSGVTVSLVGESENFHESSLQALPALIEKELENEPSKLALWRELREQ